jgi:hypothetical protein
MKTIFNDPMLWSKYLVGSKLGFGLMVGLHIVVGLTSAYMFGFTSSLLLLIFGVWFPFLYLYALRRLLIFVENKNQQERT